MATFIIGDIHNTLTKLNEMIRLISLTMQDQVILLGDLFIYRPTRNIISI